MASRRLNVVVLLLALTTACSTSRVVRLDTGQGEPLIHIPRTVEAGPVDRYTQREGVVPLDGQPSASQGAKEDTRVTQEYLRFCEAIGKPGDCRKVLMNSPILTGDGRYALGMSFAIEEIVPEMMQAFKDMADPEALKATLYWTMTIYAAMWLVPEPVFSKGLATVITATFICYIGVDTLWTLIQGWRRLVEESDHATSFSAIRDAGKKYGRVMGKNAVVRGHRSSSRSSTRQACRWMTQRIRCASRVTWAPIHRNTTSMSLRR